MSRKKAKRLTQSRLRLLLHYDPDTGVFTWKVRTSIRITVGAIAGSPDAHGYLQIVIDYKHYKAHRLAWLYVYGHFPSGDLDHIDGVPSHNAINNLRVVTMSENLQNMRRARKDNKCGLLGVCHYRGAWLAQIQANGRRVYLGQHRTSELAQAAYLAAKKRLHPFQTLV